MRFKDAVADVDPLACGPTAVAALIGCPVSVAVAAFSANGSPIWATHDFDLQRALRRFGWRMFHGRPYGDTGPPVIALADRRPDDPPLVALIVDPSREEGHDKHWIALAGRRHADSITRGRWALIADVDPAWRLRSIWSVRRAGF
jgi:hypothetical protein